MTSPILALRAAILARCAGDAALATLLGGIAAIHDEPPPGAPVAVMLVGDAPYARVYVPEPLRMQVGVGDVATVHLGADGGRSYRGRVRMIRSEPTFTPYYALTGKDAARLSYLAEVELEGEGVAELPAGLPLRVEFQP